MSLIYHHTDESGDENLPPRELTVDVEYDIVLSGGGIDITDAIVTHIDGRYICGPEPDWNTPECAAESAAFLALVRSDAGVRERIEEAICERAWDQRYGDDYERGAE